jgi:predicted aldo/keto reductase-like oxidoreductase
MKTDYLDFLFAHNIGGQSTDNIDQIGSVLWPWMKQQKQAGKVRFIGFSSMSSHAKSKEFLEKLDPDVCILALSPYDAAKRYLGYYDAGFVTNALPVAASKNVGVIAMKSIRYIANIAKPLATPTECLAYVLNTLKGVHSVVVGMVGEPQVVNNVGLIKDVVGTGIKVDEHAFLKRLAPYANEKHVLWMRPDYKDNGQPNGGLFC